MRYVSKAKLRTICLITQFLRNYVIMGGLCNFLHQPSLQSFRN